jgi:lipopolysaccharide/colanic/teichoic acid biosynthesis glycosyltransferase
MRMNWVLLSSVPERLLALALLACILPTLLLIGFFLRSNSDQPVLLLDEVRAGGTTARSYRFRTTGRGSTAFQKFGRLLRASGWDEFPALWSVVLGHIRLRKLLHLWRLL